MLRITSTLTVVGLFALSLAACSDDGKEKTHYDFGGPDLGQADGAVTEAGGDGPAVDGPAADGHAPDGPAGQSRGDGPGATRPGVPVRHRRRGRQARPAGPSSGLSPCA